MEWKENLAFRSRGLSRGLRLIAAGVALHGGLLWLFGGVVPSWFPQFYENGASEFAQQTFFWLLAVPSLLLARPFEALIWKFGLMNAPGWFTWPKPLGFVLVYSAWVVVLLFAAWAAERMARPPT